jgi:predicted Zn-dependent protease with MMP-like domain
MRRADRFQRLVREALDEIPAAFRPFLERVEVRVEDWPDPLLLASLGLPEDDTLYGLYQGTPLTERGHDPDLWPERILIFRGPLEEDFPEAEELREEIRITVLHEVAHHFGLDEARLRELGLD